LTGIIPGTLALIKQGKKDDKDAELASNKLQFDVNSAANAAAIAIIEPLKLEVTRLQNRIGDLEQALISKSTEIGTLMQAGIDKDVSIRQLEYTLSGMQLRLDAFEDRKRTSAKARADSAANRQQDVLISDKRREEDLKLDEKRREEVKISTEKSIKELVDKSIMNGKKVEEINSEVKKEGE
jgi:hypothetical protein